MIVLAIIFSTLYRHFSFSITDNTITGFYYEQQSRCLIRNRNHLTFNLICLACIAHLFNCVCLAPNADCVSVPFLIALRFAPSFNEIIDSKVLWWPYWLGYPWWNISVTNDHEYVPSSEVATFSSLFWLINGFIISIIQRAPLIEDGLGYLTFTVPLIEDGLGIWLSLCH